jgi:hypothetical protein
MLFGDTAMEALLRTLTVLLGAFDTAPEDGGCGGCDGDAALALLGHPVHNGVTVVDLAESMGEAGIEQDTFGCRRFTRVYMRHDPDISDPAQRDLFGYLYGHLLPRHHL